MRTQQIVGLESGVTLTPDPLAGSYYVESLTSALEQEAFALLSRIDEMGGAAKAISSGFFQEEIGRSAYEHQLRVERAETTIVGVNRFADGTDAEVAPSPDYSALEREQASRVRAVRASRDGAVVQTAVCALREAASAIADFAGKPHAPLMPLIIDAVRARASVGEISDVFSTAWGAYQPGR